MKIIGEKKGFTLIELLAVIVVLAIVAIVGYSTILPLLGNTRRNAFLSEANYAVDAASRAVSVLQLGSMSASDLGTNSRGAANANGEYKYCFTVKALADAGLYNKEEAKATDAAFKGRILVVPSGNTFTYTVTMTNGTYQISSIAADALKLESVTDGDGTGLTVDCSATDVAW